jgi:hypothetical protein
MRSHFYVRHASFCVEWWKQDFPVIFAVRNFLAIALATTIAVADESVATSEFTSKTLSAESRDAILERARCLRQDSPDRLQLNADVLRSMNYFLQIPKEFGGSKEAGYRSNWSYVRELPIIKYYYVEQDRTVPPATLPSSSE